MLGMEGGGVHMQAQAHTFGSSQKPEEDTKLFEAGVTDNCEQPDVSAGN